MPTLTFVRAEDDYSVYRTRDDEEVYLEHGGFKRLVPFEDLDWKSLWPAHVQMYGLWQQERFLDNLRALVVDPDEVDDLGFCTDCAKPEHEDDLVRTGNEGHVCTSCEDDYNECDRCEELFRYMTETLHDTRVCDDCRDDHFSYCESCDGYYRDGSEDHSRCEDCNCESPAQRFTVRNDGDGPLRNDTRVTVSLPAGVISDEGMGEIAHYLRWTAAEGYEDEDRDNVFRLANRLEELGTQWQTRQGNFTKRLSRFAYNEYKLKLTPDVISHVGCVARDHSTAVDFAIETTRNLNLPAEDFAHEDSCWWQSYAYSRCALKSNGGFGIRTFNDNGWGSYVSGRAWVMPLKLSHGGPDLTPTFETQEPDAFVVFNGYGDLEGYAPARLVAHMAGMTYRKIGFTCSPMYVNNNSGYLVAPEEIAERFTDGCLNLSVQTHANLFATEKEKVLAHA